MGEERLCRERWKFGEEGDPEAVGSAEEGEKGTSCALQALHAAELGLNPDPATSLLCDVLA